MSLQAWEQATWEQRLLSWAHEALEAVPAVQLHPPAGADLLPAAYDYCESVTRVHSRTFFLASALLPGPRRLAARALYAFCRVTDDLVDRAAAAGPEALLAWRRRALGSAPATDDPVALAWNDTRHRYAIPRRYAEQLIEGVSRDLVTARYASFDDLAAYCYGVASTVGLMAMHLIGYAGARAIPYAVKLGVALQLTNILRDVGEDWRAGRIYLPRDELQAFGLDDGDLAAGQVTGRWRTFMRFQLARNRALYDQALPGIALLHPRGRLAISAAAELYRGILARIEANDYDVFTRRAHLPAGAKLCRLPGIWWRAQTLSARTLP